MWAACTCTEALRLTITTTSAALVQRMMLRSLPRTERQHCSFIDSIQHSSCDNKASTTIHCIGMKETRYRFLNVSIPQHLHLGQPSYGGLIEVANHCVVDLRHPTANNCCGHLRQQSRDDGSSPIARPSQLICSSSNEYDDEDNDDKNNRPSNCIPSSTFLVISSCGNHIVIIITL